MLDLLPDYVTSPHVGFSHALCGGLLFGIFRHGTSLPKVAILGLLLELLCGFVWWLTPDDVKGLGMVALLYFAIKVYEHLTGPRVKVHQGAVFIAEESAAEILLSAGKELVINKGDHPDGRLVLQTDLAYAEYWLSFWGGPAGKWAIDIADVHSADEGCEKAIVRSITDAKIQTSQCFNLRVGQDLSVTCAAETNMVRDQWVEGFRRLLGNRLDHYKMQTIDNIFDDVSSSTEDGVQGVSLNGVIKTLQRFGRVGHKPYTKEIYSTFAKISNKKNTDGEPILTKEVFSKFLDLALKRPDIHQIYERLLIKTKKEVALSPQRLKDFMKEEQKEDVSISQCKDWITQHECVIPFTSFSSVGFTSFLLSEDQSIFNRHCSSVYQDMSQPLSHYYIATSHNTYLLQGQLKGKSSVEAYITAFKKGCKCVELDCWDGPNNEPIIYHGHTLTSRIFFKDVIVAIRDYAFCKSDFPVILSFENHCSLEQQKIMANHLATLLGDLLYTKPIPEEETQLPSPESLKGFIICKHKKEKSTDCDSA